MLLTGVIAVVVPTFLALFWWQVQRVRQGNTLSWAYVFEWPFFTGYAVYLWWKLVHEAEGPEMTGLAAEPTRSGTAPDAELRTAHVEAKDELASYNRYLARLNASKGPRRRS